MFIYICIIYVHTSIYIHYVYVHTCICNSCKSLILEVQPPLLSQQGIGACCESDQPAEVTVQQRPRAQHPKPPSTSVKGLMVSIRWYVGSLKGSLGGAGSCTKAEDLCKASQRFTGTMGAAALRSLAGFKPQDPANTAPRLHLA